jgi:hypothetical protein
MDVDHDENDAWQITRGGLYIPSKARQNFLTGAWTLANVTLGPMFSNNDSLLLNSPERVTFLRH